MIYFDQRQLLCSAKLFMYLNKVWNLTRVRLTSAPRICTCTLNCPWQLVVLYCYSKSICITSLQFVRKWEFRAANNFSSLTVILSKMVTLLFVIEFHFCSVFSKISLQPHAYAMDAAISHKQFYIFWIWLKDDKCTGLIGNLTNP